MPEYNECVITYKLSHEDWTCSKIQLKLAKHDALGYQLNFQDNSSGFFNLSNRQALQAGVKIFD